MGRRNAARIKRRRAREKARLKRKEYGRLFNGNVYAQGEFIFIWSLILAFCLILWLLFFLAFRPIREQRCERYEVVISSYEIVNGEDYIKLNFTAGGKDYTSAYVKSLNGFEDARSVGRSVNILVYKDEVVRLSISGREYISLGDVNAIRADSRRISLIFLILGGVWLVYVGVSWYVMYNAEKFPRLVRAFVKPSYLNKKKIYGKAKR